MRPEDQQHPDTAIDTQQEQSIAAESRRVDTTPKGWSQRMMEGTSIRVATVLAGAAIGVGAVELADRALFSSKTPATPTVETVKVPSSKIQEKKEASRPKTTFDIVAENQAIILGTQERTTYYLDENGVIVGQFPAFQKPGQKKGEADDAYKTRIAKALTDWHKGNRETLAANGVKVDIANFKPRSQNSFTGEASVERIKAKATPKIQTAYASFKAAFEKTALYKYLATDELRQEFIDLCVYGQVATESAWNENAQSPAECHGLWQLQAENKGGKYSGLATDVLNKKKKTLTENFGFTLEEDHAPYIIPVLRSPQISSIMAASSYDMFFNRIDDVLAKFRQTFPFKSDESFQRNLVIPMLFSAYNNGGGNIHRLMEKFLEQHAEKYKQNFDEQKFTMDLINWCYEYDNSGAGKAAFGPDAVKYAIKVNAYKTLLKREFRGGAMVDENADQKVKPIYADKFKHDGNYAGEYSKLLQEAKDEGIGVLEGTVPELVKAGELVKVDDQKEQFRFAKDLLTTPHVAEYALYPLRQIAEEFTKKSGGYRFVISDLYRAEEDQKKLNEVKYVKKGKKLVKIVVNDAATRGVSTHELGNTFDITKMRIVNPQGKVEFSDKFKDMIRNILMAHQRRGEIMIVEEKLAFHVMVAKPLFGEIPQPK